MSRYTPLISILVGLLLSSQVLADTLTVKNAWSPEAPPTARVMAGYMEITHQGNQEVLIEKITSPQFKTVEMHRTIHKDGMAMMKWQPHIHVPIGKVTKLEPGGKHLMLIKPLKRLQAGDRIELKLQLSNQRTQTVTMTVKKR
jgi:copper(I)-binding protein